MTGHNHQFTALLTNNFAIMTELFTPSLLNILWAGIPACGMVYLAIDRLPPPRWWSIKSQLIGLKSPAQITSLECPYAYIRSIYGQYHWAPFVHKISPTLRDQDPGKYNMVLEIMDAIHLCLMLVDDVGHYFTLFP